MKKVVIAHLYPAEMNIYGDLGNIRALVKRLEWRGYKPEVKEVGVGDEFDFTSADIIFAGGGQDRGQVVVAQDLLKRAQNLKKAVEEGVVVLAICGTYQLFGNGFTTSEGQEIPGIGIFKAHTVGSGRRMIGNIVVESQWGELVGFENHSGETLLEPDQQPLGKVLKGFGNNYDSGFEGAVTNNAFGTYLHGPILPKNPQFADHLILTALIRKHGVTELELLDDSLEKTTAEVAKHRP